MKKSDLQRILRKLVAKWGPARVLVACRSSTVCSDEEVEQQIASFNDFEAHIDRMPEGGYQVENSDE